MTNTSKLIHDLTWLAEMGAASPEDIARVVDQARTALTKSEALSRKDGRWEDLPVASFAESGTNVPTGIFTTWGDA